MNKKQTYAFAMLAMVFGIAASPIISADDAEARTEIEYVLSGDLTAPSGDKPFGGEDVGSYHILGLDSTDSIAITFSLEKRPSEGMVYEGWLIDVETGEKLSTGIFKGKIHERTQFGFFGGIDEQFHYDIFVITEEPIIDTDPNPNKPVAGVPLSAPFGQ